MTILVDTSAFLAILDGSDRERDRAVATMDALGRSQAELVTHQYVVVETISLAQRRLGLAAVRRFVDDLLPVVDVAWVDPATHAEALEALLASGSRSVSLVDRVSFLVMRRQGIDAAFAFDDDFAREGFRTLPA
ncbi:MAG: PIN domain-containing protein [Chloroflexi bacterium]|nr:PIN domain-containing protein [Chloroflexota bacterium]